jgi:hypothetical protein
MTHPLFKKDIFVETAFEKRLQQMLHDAWDNRSWHLIVKGVLRFKPHTRRKQQTPLTEKRWSATGKTDWDVVGG